MFNSPAGILVLVAIICFVASLLPMVPEKYTTAAGGIILAVAVLITIGA